jgi:type I restriction enzyme S subunit
MIKPGYKQTKVGVIPLDWDTLPVRHLVERLDAGISVNSVERELMTFAHGQSVLKTSSVFEGKFFPHESKQIAPRDLWRVSLKPRADTILISRMNTPDLVGECGYVAKDYENLYLPDRLWMTKQRRGIDASIRWLSYLLSSKPQKTRIKERATGTSGSMKNLSKDSLLDLRIPVPPLSEQRAIAEALSDVDELLESLDRLIAKKRDVKQAAMQQLLTGQTRLPGFSGEWEMKKLIDLGTTFGGLTGKTKSDFGHGSAHYISFMNVITNVAIDTTTFGRVRVSPTESQNLVRRGDLLLNGSSETPEDVALCAVLLDEAGEVYLNSFCFGFRFREGARADGLYFAYYLRSTEGREIMKSLAQGSTRYNLSKKAFLGSYLPLPCYDEQVAIAEVLSDLDAELGALEQRREKTRVLKRGMMQELLTGRTRLV